MHLTANLWRLIGKMNYRIEFLKQAQKDYEKVNKNHAIAKIVKRLLLVLESNPFTPPFELLSGNLAGTYSRRINRQHRLVYTVNKETKLIRIMSMWTHYENV